MNQRVSARERERVARKDARAMIEVFLRAVGGDSMSWIQVTHKHECPGWRMCGKRSGPCTCGAEAEERVARAQGTRLVEFFLDEHASMALRHDVGAARRARRALERMKAGQREATGI